MCFFVLQGVYSCFLLYKLARKSPTKLPRSKSLIFALIILIYSSIVLSVLFGMPQIALKAQDESTDRSLALKIYLVFCRDLPFSLTFIAHQIILSQYYELALILDVLIDMRGQW